MKISMKKGMGFGLTSGILTTLGMIFGLNSSTHSLVAVVSGIALIAIADSLSDAMGIHISEEVVFKHSEKHIWAATLFTFFSKLIVSFSFIVPFFIFSFKTSIIFCGLWGFFLLTVASIYLAKKQKLQPIKVVSEHILLAIIIIFITHNLGKWIGTFV